MDLFPKLAYPIDTINTGMRKVMFQVRSLGSKKPESPSLSKLTEWICEKHGTAADLTLWEIEETLKSQTSHVSFPAAGGEFYRERVLDAFSNISDDSVIAEFDLNVNEIVNDISAARKISKQIWWSVPGPSELFLTDKYFFDEDELMENLVSAEKNLCRTMRDFGVLGHILSASVPSEIELEKFSGKKFLWHVPDESLEDLLELQRDIVIGKAGVEKLSELFNSYTIRNIYAIDPDVSTLTEICRYVDPEYVNVCGTAPNSDRETYWKNLSELSILGEDV